MKSEMGSSSFCYICEDSHESQTSRVDAKWGHFSWSWFCERAVWRLKPGWNVNVKPRGCVHLSLESFIRDVFFFSLWTRKLGFSIRPCFVCVSHWLLLIQQFKKSRETWRRFHIFFCLFFRSLCLSCLESQHSLDIPIGSTGCCHNQSRESSTKALPALVIYRN